jgi:hypothetical protein
VPLAKSQKNSVGQKVKIGVRVIGQLLRTSGAASAAGAT